MREQVTFSDGDNKINVQLELGLKEREVWTRVACAVASANDCKTDTTAINWANSITDAYVKRFGKSEY